MAQFLGVFCNDAMTAAGRREPHSAALVKVCTTVPEAKAIHQELDSVCTSDHAIVVFDSDVLSNALSYADILRAIAPLTEAQEAALTKEQFIVYRTLVDEIRR